MYLYLKAFHLFFVVAWFAGIFYLPRLFVNLAMCKADSETQRLLLMAHKLYRFMTPLAVLSIVCGVLLWKLFAIAGMWLHIKMLLVLVLIAYHLFCGRLLGVFEQGQNKHSHTWYRVFNEIPVVILLIVIMLTVVKPF